MAKRVRASDEFVEAYIECALWSSTDNADESGGEPLDRNYDVNDMTLACKKQMRADCDDFVALCAREGQEWHYKPHSFLDPHDPRAYADDERAGHDFWLTRNRHGAGFWDRGLTNGEELTKLAQSFGETDLYVYRKKIHHG